MYWLLFSFFLFFWEVYTYDGNVAITSQYFQDSVSRAAAFFKIVATASQDRTKFPFIERPGLGAISCS